MASKLAKMVADFRTTLATEIAVGGTTGTLQSYTDKDGVALPTGTYFLTLDIESTKKEHIVCTMTAGALTSIKSISRQGVQTNGTARKHRIGASVVITDFTHIMYMNDLLSGTTDLNASVPLKYDADPTLTLNSQLATVKFVNDTAIAAGAIGSHTTPGIYLKGTTTETAAGTDTNGTYTYVIPVGLTKATTAGVADAGKVPILDASGLLASAFIDYARTWSSIQTFPANKLQITSDAASANDPIRYSQVSSLVGNTSALTTGEAINGSTTPQVVCVKASDGLVYKADANDATLNMAIGFVNTNALITTNPTLITTGVLGGFTGLTQNATYYVSDTAGSISTTQSTTCAIPVGKAISTTQLLVSFGKRVATGSITHSSAAAGTQDVTTTIGFRATKITLGVSADITGSTSTGSTRATLVYMGTTQISKGAFNEDDNAATAITSANIVTGITDIGASGVGAYARSAGGNRAEIFFTLNSISATGFVTRMVNALNAGAGGNSSGTITFIAEE